MRVCDEILRYLSKNKVKSLYGVPSGTISPIVDSLNDIDNIEFIITKNEAAASYAATKYAKVTQKLGVCLMSGSVGVANAVNGIAEALETKASILIIGGFVSRWQQGLGAIQEIETDRIIGGLVKYYKKVVDEKDVIKEIKKAIEISMEHPRGPVYIGIPLDVQRELYTGIGVSMPNPRKIETDYNGLDKVIKLIDECNNGVLIVGGGCRNLGGNIKKLEEKLNWRIVTTTSGKSVLNEDYRLNMGNFGFPGTDLANNYLKRDDIDCILALGTKLGEPATGNFSKDLIRKKMIHIDIDNNIFNRAYNEDLNVVADLNIAINYIAKNIKHKNLDNDIREPQNYPYVQNHTGLSLRMLYEKVTDILPKNTFYMNDMGNSMIFCFKYLKVPAQGDFECNMNYACMGSSIGAIGINRISPDRPIAVFMGDGSFFMNGMSELLTVKKYDLKIVFFVINNSSLSFVDLGHKSIFNRTYSGFYNSPVDISAIAKSMDIQSTTIKSNDDIDSLKDLLSEITEPIVINVITDSTEPIPTNRFRDLSGSVEHTICK